MIHEKYQQTFKGIKVEFKEYIIHRDKENNVISLNGDFEKIPLSFDIEKKNIFTNILNKYTREKKSKTLQSKIYLKKNILILSKKRYIQQLTMKL